MMMASAGCANNGAFQFGRQADAAARQAVANAREDIPALASVCRRERPHAEPRAGDDAYALLAREGDVVDQLNKDKRECHALENRWRGAAR